MSELLEGYYKANDTFYKILKNENGTFRASDASGTEFSMQVEYGDFGEADPEVEKRSKGKTYNVKLTISVGDPTQEIEKEEEGGAKKMDFSDLGVIFDEGRKCSMKGFTGIAGLEKITEKEFEEIMNDFEPIEAPPGPYKLQPEKKGKILWFTGAPGMGKSTSAQLLARNHGYVYYEADCFGGCKNPYVPLDAENPSMAQIYQKPLRGQGTEERKAVVKKVQATWGDMMGGKDYDKEALREYYSLMAEDIGKEKKRIGGDFAIAHVLLTADFRALMRELLGPDLIIIVLTMSSADRRQRIVERHHGDEHSADVLDQCEKIMEGVKENEPNTIEMNVGSSMTKDEVVAEIMQRIEQLRC